MSKETEYKLDPEYIPGICDHCRKGQALPKHGYLCQACYDDGWRAGKEMFAAIEKDPNFVITKEGNLDYLPDSMKKNT